MSELSKKKCVACEGGTPPLSNSRQQEFLGKIEDDWRIVDHHQLERVYKFKDFKSALEFTNRVGAIAEEQGHHPDILLTYGKVKITLWTHAAGGLTENDFIMAAKIDAQ